jgi:hypothetical protein
MVRNAANARHIWPKVRVFHPDGPKAGPKDTESGVAYLTDFKFML